MNTPFDLRARGEASPHGSDPLLPGMMAGQDMTQDFFPCVARSFALDLTIPTEVFSSTRRQIYACAKLISDE